MKTHVLSTRIDNAVYDWLFRKTKGKNMSKTIFNILKATMESEKKHGGK